MNIVRFLSVVITVLLAGCGHEALPVAANKRPVTCHEVMFQIDKDQVLVSKTINGMQARDQKCKYLKDYAVRKYWYYLAQRNRVCLGTVADESLQGYQSTLEQIVTQEGCQNNLH